VEVEVEVEVAAVAAVAAAAAVSLTARKASIHKKTPPTLIAQALSAINII
jgi:hypothetical protein